jgi:hypothetical protein
MSNATRIAAAAQWRGGPDGNDVPEKPVSGSTDGGRGDERNDGVGEQTSTDREQQERPNGSAS